MRFAVTMRYDHKQILTSQKVFFEMGITILNKIQEGKSLKEAYLSNVGDF